MPRLEYDRERANLTKARIAEARKKKDYYTVTPKGFQLGNLISARITEIRSQHIDTDSPEYTEYLRLFHTNEMLIKARDSHGVWINPAYQVEEEEALEDLIEGGYIVRSSS
jgi:hypothetical protein